MAIKNQIVNHTEGKQIDEKQTFCYSPAHTNPFTLGDFITSFTSKLFMEHTVKKLDKSQVELTITVPVAEYEPALEKAAVSLSKRTAVKGFRKGHVPFDVLKKEVGEMAILQEALEGIVQSSYVAAVQKEELDVVGTPQIQLEKVAPGNDIVYKATLALLPEVTLPKLDKISVEAASSDVEASRVDETLESLRGMNAKEIKKDGKASGTDKLVLDMNMSIDGVPVDGGQARDHQVYLSEEHYIPGFNKEVEGLKAGEEKTFTLTFPKDHYQKQLAGKEVSITVNVKDVFERQLPELNDDFAKTLNMDSVQALRETIEKNMKADAVQRANQQTEIKMLDAVIEKTTFAEIPDVIIDSERQKMYYELTRDLEKNGITVEQYLADIKKDEQALLEDFTAQAQKRAKAALLSRQVAKEHALAPTEEEIDAEVELLKNTYQHSKEAQDNLAKPEVRDSIASMVQNRKVMAWLKEQVVKEPKAKKAPAKKKAASKKSPAKKKTDK